MRRLDLRLKKLEERRNNGRTCQVCGGSGRPFGGIDSPPRPATHKEWLKQVQWSRSCRAGHKRAEEWAALVADDNPAVAADLRDLINRPGS